jgi:hypothetical protein
MRAIAYAPAMCGRKRILPCVMPISALIIGSGPCLLQMTVGARRATCAQNGGGNGKRNAPGLS